MSNIALQAVGRHRLGQRPPPPSRQVAHHGDAVHAGTFGIELAQPPAGLVQRQGPPDRHARDQRIVDHYWHGTSRS
jgi:hypothetical protein